MTIGMLPIRKFREGSMSADYCRGWFMNRRKMLALLGLTGANVLGRHSSANSSATELIRRKLSCVVTPEQTEGPYFVDERLRRSDIRADPSDGSIKEGLRLALEIRVFSAPRGDASDCKPIEGAFVDIWHCDAQGIYSDVTDRDFNTVGKKFLRGYQVSDKNGGVRFITLYPGWYPGRTVHIHFKIRTDSKYMRPLEFTSQFYFDDSITDSVYVQHPAYARKGSYLTRVRNEDDSIYRKGGERLMLKLVKMDEGYAATFDVGLENA
ncbi:intradiol ring-cleavage dioxygenase [Nitrosospira briensis]|uniref:intradiol ring-cleavage dioxygenase n=1 Tax=Nitrosospira briensis TaxID=35799 RepID=UPI0008ECF284|nr:intradiol ring-cleavage dioxygenase [Nitrosospira briensis]SFO36426.1 Protocatechuate 3,4-dioxygenase beta subunit [Nitrosospira briensis]